MKSQDAEFDENGVPVVSIRKLGAKYYNPVRVAVAAGEYLRQWETTKNDLWRRQFMACVDSLVENLRTRRDGEVVYGVWEYEYPFSYDLEPPWVSALAQGMGAEILCKAFEVSGGQRYKEAAGRALDALYVEVKDGGVTYKDSDSEWWYEEFVGKGAKVSRALNGMMYALLSIHEYSTDCSDGRTRVLWSKGLQCLKSRLMTYDAGWWTYYDALGTIASKSYHGVHIDLLRKVHEVTSDPIFKKAIERWRGYRTGFVVREFIRQKPSWHDWVVLLLNIGIVLVAFECGVYLYLRLSGV